MQIPSAIIICNNDMSQTTKNVFVNQLYINESMSGSEFDARLVADPNYATVVHLNKLRILVYRDDFRDYTNRTIADVVFFYKNGLATILKNNFGPPELSLNIERFYIYQLLRYNHLIP